MNQEDKERLLHVIRDRYSVARHIVLADENRRKSYAEGYFAGWQEATLIILNYLGRTDLLASIQDNGFSSIRSESLEQHPEQMSRL